MHTRNTCMGCQTNQLNTKICSTATVAYQRRRLPARECWCKQCWISNLKIWTHYWYKTLLWKSWGSLKNQNPGSPIRYLAFPEEISIIICIYHMDVRMTMSLSSNTSKPGGYRETDAVLQLCWCCYWWNWTGIDFTCILLICSICYCHCGKQIILLCSFIWWTKSPTSRLSFINKICFFV